jgi:rubrerythrin
MVTLSEKELSALEDLLSLEESNVKKYNMLTSHVQDTTLQKKLQNISNAHQQHFNTLFSHLN